MEAKRAVTRKESSPNLGRCALSLATNLFSQEADWWMKKHAGSSTVAEIGKNRNVISFFGSTNPLSKFPIPFFPSLLKLTYDANIGKDVRM